MTHRYYSSAEEVRTSEAYRFYCGLGYTETQSVLLTVMDLDKRLGGFPHIVEAFDKKKKEDGRSFSEFFCDYVFDPERLERDGFRMKPVESGGRNPRSGGGLFGGLFRQTKASGGRKGLAREAGLAADAYEDGAFEPAEAMMSAPGAAMPSPAMNMAMPASSMMAERRAMPSAAAEMMPEIPAFSMEDIRTDSYETIEEKGFRNTAVSPTSTFRTTYNTAAAAVLLSNIRRGADTRASMVRTEELLNYLSYELKEPGEEMFEVTKELQTLGGRTLLFLGIQGKRTLPSRQNICFLLDVSGSMSSRSEQMMMSIAAVLSRMNDGDLFSLVTYSNQDHVVINGLKLKKEKDIDTILQVIVKNVYISGATYGSAGLSKAYEIIEANKIEDGVNRVIILTDGDLNFGITDKDGLKGFIEKKKESGAYFSAIGTGIYNLQDDKLETLAKNGNGNYFVVNEQSDIEKNIVGNYESLVYPIAKNVKAQVEFNPAKVGAYRLIGYENRALSHEDFRDDKVIAEPFGSGSYCIALYELKLQEEGKVTGGLKYQETVVKESDEIATLTLRYEDTNGNGFHELSFPVGADLPGTDNIRKAAECAEIAEKLRGKNADALTKERLRKLLEA